MLRIRTMTADDLPLGLRLREQAGWNQTEADWRRLLELSRQGSLVAEWNAVPVATTVTCRFGDVAWVAMVLVERSVRGRGVGTALMRRAIDFLDESGVRAIRLDATALGLPVYEKLGFVPQFALARYEGLPVLQRTAGDRGTAPLRENRLPELMALDADATHTDRGPLLARLFAERAEAFRTVECEGRIVGYVAARPGAQAWQVGPCIAVQDEGRHLLFEASSRLAGQSVFIDVPLVNDAAVRTVESLGLRPQRELLRMCRGVHVVEDVLRLWASSGPELG